MRNLIFLAIFLFCLLPNHSKTNAYSAAGYKPFTVVIDAGHGGKDSGAVGSKTKEKDIALQLALLLGRYIRKYSPEVKVLYTRTQDVFIPLYERTEFANQNQADVFFSIHCNALLPSQKHISGTETYVMGLPKENENRRVAKRENKALLLEQNHQKNYNGYDSDSQKGHIILSMFQNAHVAQSLLLATQIEKQFKNGAKRKSRGVKQAGFVVLRTANMPSVLIETGFLTNGAEENYLNSPQGQSYIASAIYRAFKTYKKSLPSSPKTSWASTSPSFDNIKPSPPSMFSPFTTNYKKEKKENPSITPHSPNTNQIYPSSTFDSNKIIFRVQLLSSPRSIDTRLGIWKTIKGVECKKIGTSYKTLIGKYINFKNARNQQNYWKINGFKDAFVVAFRNKKKISLKEALQK